MYIERRAWLLGGKYNTMLSRTLRSSRSAPSLRSSANGGGQAQQALLHTSSPVTKPSPALMRSSQPSPLKGSSPRKDFTVAELKLELKSRGLKTTGRKQEVCVESGLYLGLTH